MNIKSQKDFFSGLMFMGVGVAFAWGATTYNVGNGARMGPGYFPLYAGHPAGHPGRGHHLQGAGGRDRWTATRSANGPGSRCSSSLLANLVFGVLLGGLPSMGVPAMGLIVAIYALTFIASMAGDELEIQGHLDSGHHAGGWQLPGLRAVLLKLQFPVWPAFITG